MSLIDAIKEAKGKLPLPQLMQAIGDGEFSKKSCRSPFRDGDNKHCFGIFQKADGEWNFKDQVTGDFGDEVDYLAKRFDLTPEDARKEFLKLAGVEAPERNSKFKAAIGGAGIIMPEFDWTACVGEMAGHVDEVARWRGFSREFVEALRVSGGIGWYEDGVAIPVHKDGKVIGCHHTPIAAKDWRYTDGCRATPVVLGNAAIAGKVVFTESQWDAYAIADRLGWHTWADDSEMAFVSTRGSGNGAFVQEFLRNDVQIITVPQNDRPDPRTGKVPSQEWENKISETAKGHSIFRASVPSKHKDANDWTRAGATLGDIRDIFDKAKDIDDALVEVFSFKDLCTYPYRDDPNSVIGDRWLCKGSQCLWLGPSGIGKSTLCFQAALYWALGLPFFGIKPKRPLKSIIFQAEDDIGDCSEFFMGLIEGLEKVEQLKMDPSEFNRLLRENFIVIRDTVHRGEKFAQFAKKKIKQLGADMVWINPLFSYAGCSVSDQAMMSAFLRDQLTPVAIETGVIWHVVHHVPKPSTDAKARQNWSDSDFSYMGFGSSEITNWARAINYIEPTKDGPFKLRLAKRGKRAQAIPDPSNDREYGSTLYLDHHEEYIFWLQVPPPQEAIDSKRKKEAKEASALVGCVWPASYSEIVEYVKSQFKCSHDAAKKRVSRWISRESIKATSNDRYAPQK